MTADNDTITKVAVSLSVIIVSALMAWVGISLQNMQIQQAKFNEKLDMISDKTREIVPRSENERRFDSLSRQADQNGGRISRIEELLMQQKR